MDPVVSPPLNYDALWQHTLETFDSLSSLRISRLRIKSMTGGQLIVGGFGDVEQAKLRTSLFGSEIVVALKKLRPTGDREHRIRVMASLARELHVWNQLSHPNILGLEGFYFDESSLKTAWIATLWQENGNIRKYLEATQPSQDARLYLALGAAKGLAYLHGRSPPVCHGDIKAENVVVDAYGIPRLCDFGLSKIIEDVPSGLTTTKTANYTLRYAAPELVSNNGSSHTIASDIWAFGCLLLFIMSDEDPYRYEANELGVLRVITQNQLPAEPDKLDLPEFIRWLLLKSWKRDPEARLVMTRHVEVIDRRTMDLLPLYIDSEVDEIVDDLKTIGDGWHAVHNPGSFDCSFLAHLDSLDASMSAAQSTSKKYRKYRFTPDGKRIATFSRTSVILSEVQSTGSHRVWDTLRGAQAGPAKPIPKEDIKELCFASDGSLLATGHANGVIRVWEFPGQRLKCQLERHEAFISSLAFADSNTILVSAASYESKVITWKLETGAVLHTLYAEGAQTVLGSPHHSFVVILCGTRKAIVYDSALGRLFKLPNLTTSVAFTPNGNSFLASRSRDDTWSDQEADLGMWDLGPLLDPPVPGGKREARTFGQRNSVQLVSAGLAGPQSYIDSVSISSDGLLAASASSHLEDLILWDLQASKPVVRMGGVKLRRIGNVSFCPGSTSRKGTLAFTYVADDHFPDPHHKIQLLRYQLSL